MARQKIELGAEGLSQQRIAEQLGISRVAVNRWVGRFALHRLDGLTDRAGRGRKPWLPQTAVQQVVQQAVTPPPHLGRWSCRTMARAAGISPAFLVYRSHLETDHQRLSGCRDDVLRKVEGAWK